MNNGVFNGYGSLDMKHSSFKHGPKELSRRHRIIRGECVLPHTLCVWDTLTVALIKDAFQQKKKKKKWQHKKMTYLLLLIGWLTLGVGGGSPVQALRLTRYVKL